ncbi:MAG TPA: ABC transporter permease [Candidatus Baltobacteraceae bacterium]
MLDLLVHLGDHLLLTICALGAALAIGLPAGVAIARFPRLRPLTLGAIGIARVIPSLAVLALMIPLVGIGVFPAVIALALLAIPPIAINTQLGLLSVPAEIVDAARGLGMSERQVRRRVVWPLALPIVFAGIRTAAVEVIASASLAAFIGGGGLGEFIIDGLASNDQATLLEGAICVSVLALAAQGLLGFIERRLTARAQGLPA